MSLQVPQLDNQLGKAGEYPELRTPQETWTLRVQYVPICL